MWWAVTFLSYHVIFVAFIFRRDYRTFSPSDAYNEYMRQAFRKRAAERENV